MVWKKNIVKENLMNNISQEALIYIVTLWTKGLSLRRYALVGALMVKPLMISRVRKNGDKTIDQVRIEEQKMHFEIIAKNTNMVIIPNFNTQVTIQKHFPGEDIILQGTLDIFPVTVTTKKRGSLLSVVDLKLTSDIYADTRFSYNSWSEPGSLDNTQAYMYHELVRDIDPELNPHVIDIINKAGIKDYDLIDKHFFYYVFDYSPRLNKKSIEVLYDDIRRGELFESVKATRNLIVSNTNKDRWEEVTPSKYNCASCPLECAYRFTTESESKERDYDERYPVWIMKLYEK